MVPPTDPDGLRAAWDALSGPGAEPGWRTIVLDGPLRHRVLAGRRMPGNEEAVLVGFGSVRLPPDRSLPQGNGFQVANLGQVVSGSEESWLALARKAGGQGDLFTWMASDVLALLTDLAPCPEDAWLVRFLGRVRAWQDFMERGRSGILDPQDEEGLFGELAVAETLLVAGVSASRVLDAWQGCRGGLHDFVLDHGAIEAKTTTESAGFPARVKGLDQFDETRLPALFCAAIRLIVTAEGETLPGRVRRMSARFGENSGTSERFATALIAAGLPPAAEDLYQRRFAVSGVTFLPVSGTFPRLRRTDVPAGVVEAHYRVSLGEVWQTAVPLETVLYCVGATGI